MKKIAILGATGSIGRQALEVIDGLGPQYQVVALTAAANDQLLAEQVIKYKPGYAALADHDAAMRLSKILVNEDCLIEAGAESQVVAATLPEADLVIMAQVGFSGFEPLVKALEKGKTVALANKESLVIGGEILKKLGLLSSAKLLPLDSEHSAIWQCIGSAARQEIKRIYLTASGGPFFGWQEPELAKVTPQMALKHPNWQMGPKITIDSATMMNKGLEVLEAKWLFDLQLDQIEVIVHRQSIIHSMVEFVDGALMAQLGTPDMRTAIQYALTYPQRKANDRVSYNPFGQTLTLESPDRNSFPCLDLAFRAGEEGGTMPAALNGANEIAVREFLAGRLKFTDLPKVIEATMDGHQLIREPSVKEIVGADQWSRQFAIDFIEGLNGRVK